MSNVSCVERIKSLGGLSVIATGIRLPGDETHDQPATATPQEAFNMGADYLAIGRAITAHADRFAAFDRILENIYSVE
jgi:orotidine-5'-phosphate decarboxylase